MSNEYKRIAELEELFKDGFYLIKMINDFDEIKDEHVKGRIRRYINSNIDEFIDLIQKKNTRGYANEI